MRIKNQVLSFGEIDDPAAMTRHVSFTPGFSRVIARIVFWFNRFNGFARDLSPYL